MLAVAEGAILDAERPSFAPRPRSLAAQVAALEAENAALKARLRLLEEGFGPEDMIGVDLMVRHRLPRQQAEILHALMAARGRPVSRWNLAATLTVRDHAIDHDVKIVDVLICKLRKKVGKGYIETIKGVGWRFNASAGAVQ